MIDWWFDYFHRGFEVNFFLIKLNKCDIFLKFPNSSLDKQEFKKNVIKLIQQESAPSTWHSIKIKLVINNIWARSASPVFLDYVRV